MLSMRATEKYVAKDMRRSAAFFALLLALLFSASLAGRNRSFSTDQDSLQAGEGLVVVAVLGGEESAKQVHAGRMLKAATTTSDYGSYDPSPSMNKPRFKPIPN